MAIQILRFVKKLVEGWKKFARQCITIIQKKT